MIRNAKRSQLRQRFVSEQEIEHVFGVSRRTLQLDRHSGRERFPSYRAGRRVLYCLEEVEAIIRASRKCTDDSAEQAGALCEQ
jgi:hypothetical protein